MRWSDGIAVVDNVRKMNTMKRVLLCVMLAGVAFRDTGCTPCCEAAIDDAVLRRMMVDVSLAHQAWYVQTTKVEGLQAGLKDTESRLHNWRAWYAFLLSQNPEDYMGISYYGALEYAARMVNYLQVKRAALESEIELGIRQAILLWDNFDELRTKMNDYVRAHL